MIHELVNRIKSMYYQLEMDEERLGRHRAENARFGVAPAPSFDAAPAGGLSGPTSPPVAVPPPAAASPVSASLLEILGGNRGAF